jgi:hypothetical protein
MFPEYMYWNNMSSLLIICRKGYSSHPKKSIEKAGVG